MTNMKVLLLPDDVYEYLQHVVRAHTLAGIEPEEGFAAAQLWSHIGRAQEVTTAPAPGPDPRDAQSEQEQQPATSCAGEGCTPDNPCSHCANENTRGN